METKPMTREIQADSGNNATGICHKKVVSRGDNRIASPIIDAEKRTREIVYHKLSKESRKTPVTYAREDTGVIL